MVAAADFVAVVGVDNKVRILHDEDALKETVV